MRFFIIFIILLIYIPTPCIALSIPLPPQVMECRNGIPMRGTEILDGMYCLDGESLPMTCVPSTYCIQGISYTCPDGTYSDVASDSLDDCLPCPDGTWRTSSMPECTACQTTPCDPTNGEPSITESPCELGITKLATSTGQTFQLYSSKLTQPSIAIGYNNGVCYVKLSPGNANNAINIKFNNTIYHTIN